MSLSVHGPVGVVSRFHPISPSEPSGMERLPTHSGGIPEEERRIRINTLKEKRRSQMILVCFIVVVVCVTLFRTFFESHSM